MIKNSLDEQYISLLKDILNNGHQKGDRTGTGTISVFGRQLRHNMALGFPLLTTKKMPFKTVVTELLWFLRGDTNIKYLLENKCNIWNGDAYQNFIKNPSYKSFSYVDSLKSQASQLLECPTIQDFVDKIKTDDEFAERWGDLGPIYGKQWRNWGAIKEVKWQSAGQPASYYDEKSFDQLKDVINQLKTNPDSRRLIVSAWNVDDIKEMVLPPCHYGFQFYTRELTLDERKIYAPNPELFEDINGWTWSSSMGLEALPSEDKIWLHDQFDQTNIPRRAISLMWNQRSVDTLLGLPFNIASYGLLLLLVAKEVNMVPEELIGNLGDVHLYNNHIDAAREQITRTGYELPIVHINTENIQDGFIDGIESLTREDFQLTGYLSDDKISAELSN